MNSFPFDSQVTYDAEGNPEYDRGYTSDELRGYLKLLYTDGVFPNPSTGLQVTTSEQEMSVTVLPGSIQIQGALGTEDTERTLVFQAAGTNYDRIDSVVARLNTNYDYRSIDLYVVKGTEATAPVAPDLTRTGGIYEMRLANVFVARNTTAISGERITDTRLDSDDCGIVTGGIETVDTSTIFEQYEKWFETTKEKGISESNKLLEEMKNILSEDAAGHLQLEIDEIKDQMELTEAELDSILKGEE